MKRAVIPVLVALMPVLAVAQTPPIPTTLVEVYAKPENAPPDLSTFVKPVDTGAPHDCDVYYQTRGAPREGVTRLRFQITPEGDVSYVFLEKTSGDDDLDTAAIACVSAWKYTPSTLVGKPVIVLARAEIKWTKAMADTLAPTTEQRNFSANHPTYVMPRSAGKPHVCMDNYPRELMQAGIQGMTWLDFTITTEGKVANLHVFRSSGNATLDQAAVTCAGAWLYTPASENGQPKEVPWKAQVNWGLR